MCAIAIKFGFTVETTSTLHGDNCFYGTLRLCRGRNHIYHQIG